MYMYICIYIYICMYTHYIILYYNILYYIILYYIIPHKVGLGLAKSLVGLQGSEPGSQRWLIRIYIYIYTYVYM